MVRTFIRRIILSLSLALYLSDVFTLSLYGEPINKDMFTVIFSTSLATAADYLQAFLWKPIYIVYVTLVTVFVIVMNKIFRRLLKVRKLLWCILLLGILGSLFNLRSGFQTQSLVRLTFAVIPPFMEALALERLSDQLTHDIRFTNTTNSVPLFVLILGESTTRLHMSLYGYPLPTTPYLDERERNGELEVFTDVISPHSHTEPCLQVLLTFYNDGLEGKWYNYPSIINVLNAANYRTVWISNKNGGAVVGRSVTRIAYHCNQSLFTATTENCCHHDGAALPLLEQSLTTIGDKGFVLLHLEGTHMRYVRRYPPEFAKFTLLNETFPQGEGKVPKDHQIIRAEYDNAVLYMDYFINSVYEMVANRSAIVLFLSDHGEEVYDDPKRIYYGHDEITGSKYMIEIPFVVWMTQTFKAQFPDLVERIHSSRDRPYSVAGLIHTILDMMQVYPEQFSPQESVINAHFSAAERIYHNHRYVRYSNGTSCLIPLQNTEG